MLSDVRLKQIVYINKQQLIVIVRYNFRGNSKLFPSSSIFRWHSCNMTSDLSCIIYSSNTELSALTLKKHDMIKLNTAC